jgi:hypothetical protein
MDVAVGHPEDEEAPLSPEWLLAAGEVYTPYVCNSIFCNQANIPLLPQEVPLSPKWRHATGLEPSLVGSDAEPGGDVRATPAGAGMAGTITLSLSVALTHTHIYGGHTHTHTHTHIDGAHTHAHTHIDGGHSNWLSRTFSPEQEQEEEQEEQEEEEEDTSVREELDSALEVSRFVARCARVLVH